jgi:hypothetical protein
MGRQAEFPEEVEQKTRMNTKFHAGFWKESGIRPLGAGDRPYGNHTLTLFSRKGLLARCRHRQFWMIGDSGSFRPRDCEI